MTNQLAVKRSVRTAHDFDDTDIRIADPTR